MNVEKIKVGYLKCNCYLLSIGNKVLVIDPGDDGEKILDMIGDRMVVGIIVTHHHFDHIGAIHDIKDKFDVLVYDMHNLSEGINKIDDFNFEVIYTPGHKEDLISIYFDLEKIMFTGDFLFKDTIGRCDLECSNINDIKESIEKIKLYNREIVIYPGHGDITNLGYEIDNNIYFNK